MYSHTELHVNNGKISSLSEIRIHRQKIKWLFSSAHLAMSLKSTPACEVLFTSVSLKKFKQIPRSLFVLNRKILYLAILTILKSELWLKSFAYSCGQWIDLF